MQQEEKSEDLRKELAFLIEEIENKKTVVVELLDQINNDETLIKEKSLNAKNLEADEQNKLLRIRRTE